MTALHAMCGVLFLWYSIIGILLMSFLVMKFKILKLILVGAGRWIDKKTKPELEHNCHDYECGLRDRGHHNDY
jgi:hypothetical protein